MTGEFVIISLGGSLIYPKGGLNINFLIGFNKLIRKEVAKGRRFFIVCGGGRLSRNYQHSAQEVIGKIPHDDVDWLGIHATRMNAQLLRTIFSDIAYPTVISHYDKKEAKIDKPIVITAGWKPGWSTDYCATLLAREYKTKNLINLSNIDVVYDKDPEKYPDAKPIEKISWENFEKLVDSEWLPGANLPFDPVATKMAKKLGLSVYILKGSNLDNLERLLEGKPFKGTIIMPFKITPSFFDKEYFEFGIGYRGYTTTILGRFIAYLTNFYQAIKVKLFLNPKTFLDVGCGIGLLVYFLRKMGVQAYGVEISRYALSKAHPSIKSYLRYGDILDLPYKKDQFEIVFSADVLEHIEESKIPQALKECDRVCQKFTIHKIYTKENKWIEKTHCDDLSQISVFTKDWWENLFNKLGFKQAKIYYPRLPIFMETIFILEKRKNSQKKIEIK